VPFRADEGWGKMLFPGPHPPSATVPPLPEGEGYLWDDGFCDFAFGSAQNDRVVWGAGKSESYHFRETNIKGVWSLVYWSLIDALCIGFGLILCLLVIV